MAGETNITIIGNLVDDPELDTGAALEVQDAEDQHDHQRQEEAEEERQAVAHEHLDARHEEDPEQHETVTQPGHRLLALPQLVAGEVDEDVLQVGQPLDAGLAEAARHEVVDQPLG